MTLPPEYPGVPRWVKALAVVALIALAAVVGVHLTSGGLAHVLDHSSPAYHPQTP